MTATTIVTSATFLLKLGGRLAGNLLGVTSGPLAGNGLLAHNAGMPSTRWTFQCGAGMADEMYRWIGDAMGGKFSRKNVQIVAVDAFGPRKAWELLNAMLTEVVFPPLDALSHGGSSLAVTLEAEQARTVELAGKDKSIPAYAPTKAWPTTRFRISIDGIAGNDLAAVTRIEALSFRVGAKNLGAGQERAARIEPTTLGNSSLTLTLPKRNSAMFYAWLDANVKGTGATERAGELQYLSNDSKPLLTLKLHGLGVASVTEGGDGVKVELNFRGMESATAA